jgi:hypothetical protein
MQYDAGTTTLENLLDVENQYFRAQDAEVQARGLAARSVVDLCRALGGGWESAVPAEGSAIDESRTAVTTSAAEPFSRSPLTRGEAKPSPADAPQEPAGASSATESTSPESTSPESTSSSSTSPENPAPELPARAAGANP